MHTKLKTHLFLTFGLFLACSDNSLTGPYAARNSEIFPLTANAKWHYKVTYSSSSHSSSSSPFVIRKEFGYLDIEAFGANHGESSSEYQLRIFQEVDSLYFQSVSDIPPGRGDTAYSKTEVSDTTYYKTLVYEDGYLWLETEDSLQRIMPAVGAKDTKIDLSIFIPPSYKDFVPVMDYDNRNFQNGSVSYVFAGDYPGAYPARRSTALIFPDSGGLKDMTFIYNSQGGGIGFRIQNLNISLQEYTPGSLE